jgi:HSP20 family protein
MFYPTLWRGSSVPPLWDEVSAARREMDRLFDRVLGSTGTASALWAPPVDVRELDDEIQVCVELPGIRPDDVSVTVENGMLTISGEKRQEVEEGKDEGTYHLVERRYGRFERGFSLPRSVNGDQVRAEFEHGVLTVHLPKAPEAKPRRVKVDIGKDAR